MFVHYPHTALSALEIKAPAQTLITTLEQRGAYVHIPRADHDYATTVGLRVLERFTLGCSPAVPLSSGRT